MKYNPSELKVTKYGCSPLGYAIIQRNITLVKLFLMHGADVKINAIKSPPIILAIYSGCVDIVWLLFRRNPQSFKTIDPLTKKTALDTAKELNHTHIVTLLEQCKIYFGRKVIHIT